MLTILLLALAGTVVSAVVGTLWYMPQTPMGKLHMRYLGFDKLNEAEQKLKMEEAKPKMPLLYAGQMVLSFVTSLAVVFIVTTSVQNGVPLTMALGFVVVNWLCFMVPVVGSSILWSNVDRSLAWQKFFSDSLSHLVIMLLVAFITSLSL